LDDIGRATTTRNRGFEGVEVNDDQIDGRNVIFLQLGHIAGQVTAPKDASEDLGVQGLHPATKDAGVGGEVFDRCNGDAKPFNEALGAAGGIKVYTLSIQFTDDGFEPILVEHGYECALDTFLSVQWYAFEVGLL